MREFCYVLISHNKWQFLCWNLLSLWIRWTNLKSNWNSYREANLQKLARIWEILLTKFNLRSIHCNYIQVIMLSTFLRGVRSPICYQTLSFGTPITYNILMKKEFTINFSWSNKHYLRPWRGLSSPYVFGWSNNGIAGWSIKKQRQKECHYRSRWLVFC